ncbi:MAG TPA: FtsX-like permease family protein [Bacteroidales bacterium]|nr:FtsX-like permease family protein [Bacteroidales bacterium]
MRLIIYKILQHKRRYIFLLISLVVIQSLVFLSMTFIQHEKMRLFPETVFNIEDCYNLEVLYPGDKADSIGFSTFKFDEESLDVIRSIEHVKHATGKSPYVRKQVYESMLFSSGKTGNIFYTETGNGFEKILGLKLLKGSLFSQSESEINEAIITKSLADSLGIFNKELPQTITLKGTSKNNNEEITCSITGIVEDIFYKYSGKNVCPIFCRRDTQKNIEFSGSVLLKLDDNADIDAMELEIGTLIQSFTKTKPVVQLISLDMVVNELWNEQKRMFLIMLSIIPLVLFYSFFAIFGLFWSEMSHDKVKYGILRSIGFNRLQVFLLGLKEAVLFSLLSFLFSGTLVLNIITIFPGSHSTQIILSNLTISFIIIFVLVVLAACIPALKFSRINPVEALANE